MRCGQCLEWFEFNNDLRLHMMRDHQHDRQAAKNYEAWVKKATERRNNYRRYGHT